MISMPVNEAIVTVRKEADKLNLTKHYSFQKPTSEEKYSVNVTNMNMDLIDSALNRVEQQNRMQDELLAPKEALNEHISAKTNPHKVTKYQIGLGNADNTSDMDKPLSIPQQTALDDTLTQANEYTDLRVGQISPASIGALAVDGNAMSADRAISADMTAFAEKAALADRAILADKAVKDGNGNIIHSTYARQDIAGVTKGADGKTDIAYSAPDITNNRTVNITNVDSLNKALRDSTAKISEEVLKINKAKISSLTNNLLATVTGTALDAVQGKVLNDKITQISNNLSSSLPGNVRLISEGSGVNTRYYAQLGADTASKKILGNCRYGTFTTPSEKDATLDINVGFKPEKVIIYGLYNTTRYYIAIYDSSVSTTHYCAHSLGIAVSVTATSNKIGSHVLHAITSTGFTIAGVTGSPNLTNKIFAYFAYP